MDGFQVLPVAFSSPSGGASNHSIYCKKHVLRQDSQLTPNNRTLFTLGWPPYVTTALIQDLFSRAGHVTSVYLQASPGPVDLNDGSKPHRGFSVGYVVFASEKDADSAIGLTKKASGDPILCPLPPKSIGVKKWARQYMLGRPSTASLEKGAEVGVALYDRQQEAKLEERKREGVADEDGWIKVTRKTPKFVNEEHSRKQRKKKRKTVGVAAYPWQQRESQREQVAELRRKFEEDKRRVALMREKRKFRPY